MELDPAELLAFEVIFGELEGGEFDWPSHRWKQKD